MLNDPLITSANITSKIISWPTKEHDQLVVDQYRWRARSCRRRETNQRFFCVDERPSVEQEEIVQGVFILNIKRECYVGRAIIDGRRGIPTKKDDGVAVSSKIRVMKAAQRRGGAAGGDSNWRCTPGAGCGAKDPKSNEY